MLDGAKFGITCAPLPIKKFKASEAFEDDVFLAIYDKNTKLVDDKNARVQGITASAIKERVRIQVSFIFCFSFSLLLCFGRLQVCRN